MEKVKWIKARCLECGREFEYPECSYKPKTCGEFECAHKHLHPELVRRV